MKSEKFLTSLFAKASEKGYTPTQLVNQCMKIDQLEKKYSKTFEELRTEFDRLTKEIVSKAKKVEELEDKIAKTNAMRLDLMREYSVDQKRVAEYVEARSQLSSLGLSVDDLANVKTCLLSLKNENFSPSAVIEKLNAIDNLEARKRTLISELERKKSEYETSEDNLKSKIKQLETDYQDRKHEINAYSELLSRGIEGNRIVSWNEMISELGIDFGVIEKELKKQRDLHDLSNESSKRLEELRRQLELLESSVQELTKQKAVMESSLTTLKEKTLKEIESSRTEFVSSITQVARELEQLSQSAKSNLESTFSELNSSAKNLSSNIATAFQRTEEQTKKQTELLETAERIGRYESVLPLLKLADNGEVTETEALVSMWSLANVFLQWLSKQKTNANRAEIQEVLRKVSISLDQEIQSVGI